MPDRLGKGKLVTRVRAKDALGKKVLVLKSTLVPANGTKTKHGGK